jgi:hypothetical protein
MTTNHRSNLDLGDTPSEEGISTADAEARLQQDPDTVSNFTDRSGEADVTIADASRPEDR